MGFVAELAGKPNRNARAKFTSWPHLGRWLALIGLGGALFGYPFFLWLDPLSIFNGFFSGWRLPFTWYAVFPAIGFIFIVFLSIFRPNAWCQRLCPLGATQEMISYVGRKTLRGKSSVHHEQPGFGRRTFLGALAGGVGALAMRNLFAGQSDQPIRPPGAVSEDQMTAMCARCGNCVRACPSQIIRPDLGQSGVAGLLSPVIDQSESYCYEWCNECTQVCPTGAIHRMDLEEKRHTAIGLAEVTKKRCIAWEDGAFCMVCQEFCPYLAIDSVEHNGVNCPVVNPDMCRGCGTCHNQCPAIPEKAINIRGIPQKRVEELPEF